MSNTPTTSFSTDPWSELAALPSRASQALLVELRRLARTPAMVTLVGPSGTGKTNMALGIHASSPRRQRPVLVENIAALPKGLVAAELFGHVKGAFTDAKQERPGLLQSVEGGTLVIDELTKAPRFVQNALLGVLEQRPVRMMGRDSVLTVDVRLVALTSTPLEVAVENGQLLPDLFERLRTTVVYVTPLDQRREDIIPIAETAIERQYVPYGYATRPHMSDSLRRLLVEMPWPGNHRQVVGVMTRVLVNAEGAKELLPAHLPNHLKAEPPQSRRERFLADLAAGVPTALASDTYAARHYRADRKTIARWKKEAEAQGIRPPVDKGQ